MCSKLKILFVGADFSSRGDFSIPQEFAKIRNAIENAALGNSLELAHDLTLKPEELQHLLCIHQPAMFHFSGHFDESGRMYLNDDNKPYHTVELDALNEVFRVHGKSIRCAFLNACNSANVSKILIRHVDCIIAMRGRVTVKTALIFTSSLYDAIGAGRSIQDAFDQARAEIMVFGLKEEDTPTLIERIPGTAAKIILASRLAEEKSADVEDNDTSRQIFISYSHKDERWLKYLKDMLKPLIRNATLSVWDDKKITASDLWRDEINKAISQARAAVLLVSNNFLASDFIAKKELPPLLEMAKKTGVKILWILVSDCLWKRIPGLEERQAAHSPIKPIDALSKSKRNTELRKICEVIETAVGMQ